MATATRFSPHCTPREKLLPRLKARSTKPGHWEARCPAHDDKDPSLSVTEVGDGGKILLHCHAGCEPTAIVAAVGLDMKDLFPDDYRSGRYEPKAPKAASSKCRAGAKKPAKDWTAAAQQYAANLQPAHRQQLAGALGLPEATMAAPALVGYSATGFHADRRGQDCWTFPEVDGAGRIIGITARYRDGAKKALADGSRGLIVPDGWREREGPVFLPEGPSDTLALTALGLAAIGRPNNIAGVELLAQLLAGVDRPIVVVGECDPKANGKWPGRDGAEKTAAALSAKLARPVSWVLPPDGAKDVREWVRSQQLGTDCTDAWSDAGERLLEQWHGGYIETKPAEPEDAAEYRAKFIDAADLAKLAKPPEWMANGVLVMNQATVLGGPRKSMKTSMLVALTVSLATGLPFLGRFRVPHQRRVTLVSGESDAWVILETLNRVCASHGITREDTQPNLRFDFRLPQLSNQDDLQELQREIVEHGTEVAIIDPLYLCLLAGVEQDGPQASNMFQMGPLYRTVTEMCLRVGCTPILAHHFKQHRHDDYAQPDLGDLAYAGIQEYAAAWLLLGRREPFQPGTSMHRLWMVAGGRIGHSGCWGVNIDEGHLAEDFTGRRWDVHVLSEPEAITEGAARDADVRETKKNAKKNAVDKALLDALDEIDTEQRGVTRTALEKATGWDHKKVKTTVERLDTILETVRLKVKIGNGAEREVEHVRRRFAGNTPGDCEHTGAGMFSPVCSPHAEHTGGEPIT